MAEKMTYEEAKSKIIVQLTQARGTLECLPVKTKQESPLNDLIEAYILAIEALEKQIPKKPKEIITSDNEYICSLCPICNTDLHEENHCGKCGQTISWGDEDGR